MLHKKRLSRNQMIAGLAVLSVIVICGVLVGGYSIYESYRLDKNAKEGSMQLESMQEKAKTDNFHFQISVSPEFESGTSEGELMIVNPIENKYKMYVEIILDDSKKEVYKSHILAPGERVRYASLSEILEKGAYPAVAVFHILDKSTEEEIGEVQAQLEIHVLS